MNDIKHIINKIEKPTDDTVVLELGDANGRPVFNFRPGQYVMISYDDEKGIRHEKHAFSLAGSPTAKDRIRLGIKIHGKFTQGIAKMKIGDEIFVSGPFGDFSFDEKKHHDLVLIAGGIGITPFLSAMEYAAAKQLPNRLSLMYSNKTLDGTLFYDEIRKLEARNMNQRALFCVTEDTVDGRWKNIVQGRITPSLIKGYVGDTAGKTFFICGPAAFMDAVKNSLLSIGVDKKRIEMEEFSMIPTSAFWAMVKNVSYAIGFSGLLMMLPFYLIYRSSQDPAVSKKYSLSNFFSSPYSSGKLYDIAKETYDEILLARRSEGKLSEVPDEAEALVSGRLPIAETVSTTTASSTPAAGEKTVVNNESIEKTAIAKTTAKQVAGAKIIAPKTVAKAPVAVKETVKSTAPIQTKTVSDQPPQTSQTEVPAPVTAASITSHPAETPTVQAPTEPATTQTPVAAQPVPTTAVSAPASSPTPVPTAPTPVAAVPTTQPTAPAPTTSASIPAASPTTVTSASTPATTSTVPTATQTTTQPAPAPTTSASAPEPAPAPTAPVVTSPIPDPAPSNNNNNNRNRDNDRDDDDEEDDN